MKTNDTPSNNIDTELEEALYNHSLTKDEYAVYIKGKREEFRIAIEADLKELIAADRDKLIKHLAFYFGLPVAEVRKVAEDVK